MEFVPFDLKNRMTKGKIQKNGETFFVGKGSFDAIGAFCHASVQNGEILSKQAETLSEKGLRVIAVAGGEQSSNIQIIGLAGIADRIRPDSWFSSRADQYQRYHDLHPSQEFPMNVLDPCYCRVYTESSRILFLD